MEDGYTQLGTVLKDQRPEDSEGDGAIVVGRFKGNPYDGVQLSYRRWPPKPVLDPEGALRLAFLLAAAVERKSPSARNRHPNLVCGMIPLRSATSMACPHTDPSHTKHLDLQRDLESCAVGGGPKWT